MRKVLASAALLVAACATIPPLRPANPEQAVPNEKSAGTAFTDGVRIVVRPEAWRDDYVDEYFTPIEVAVHNGSARAVQVRPASFSLLAPGGFRYDALTPADVRSVIGPMRAGNYGGYGYVLYPWGAPYGPWVGPYGGWWGWNGFGPGPWVGPVIYYGGRRPVPSHALAQGTVEPGGSATVLLFFPVPADKLNALELHASLSDAAGQKVAELRVPFVREGKRAEAMPLAPTAAPPVSQPGAAPSPQGPSWQTTPPPPPKGAPPPPPQGSPPPAVDQPVGPPVPAPDSR